MEGEVYYHPRRSISQTLVQIRSVNTVPRHGNVYGEIQGGELALKAFLLELPNSNQMQRGVIVGHMDNRHAIGQDSMIYFIPFAEVEESQSSPEHCRTFAGVFVQQYSKLDCLDKPLSFRRVGYGEFSGRLHRDFLDSNSWAELCGLSQPNFYGQDLVII